MKFQSILQKQLFCVEIEKPELLSTINESWEPSNNLLELFFQKRAPQINLLKDFRKSQNTKQSWRKNRYGYMKGIIAFHKSTQGKKQHRQLGNWLATHNFYDGIFNHTQIADINKDESLDELCEKEVFVGFMNSTDKNNVLKALSSIRTHLFIEGDYFRSLHDDLNYHILLDEAINVIHDLEKRMLSHHITVPLESLEFCLRVTEPEFIIKGFSEKYSLEESFVKTRWNAAKQSLESKNINEEQDGYMSILVSRVCIDFK